MPDSVAILNGSIINEESSKPRFLISDLCVYLETYLKPAQIREVYRAYLFSAEAHEGQIEVASAPGEGSVLHVQVPTPTESASG